MPRYHLTKPYDSMSCRNAHYAIVRELTADGITAWQSLGPVGRRRLAQALADGNITLPEALNIIKERFEHDQTAQHPIRK